MVLVFLMLSGTNVHAQNSQTGVKKEIADHSGQTDKIVGKKIQQQTISNNRFEKLDSLSCKKSKPHGRKHAYKKKQKLQ